MFDYTGTINKANSLSNTASSLRSQSGNLDQLLGIVGSKYSGKDADAYSVAVKQAKAELTSIASELDSIASRIRSAAQTIRDEELAEQALLAEQAKAASK